MTQDCSVNKSLSENRDFWFNFDGYWEKIGTWVYKCWDADIVSDKVSKMTFDRIKKHFSDLGYPNPKAICVRDPDKNFKEGLYLIEDEESCRKSLQYIEVLNVEKVEFFIDDDNMPLPDDITPSILLVPTMCSDGNNIESERVQELVDVRVVSQYNWQESEYVNPVGYISEEDDAYDDGEFVSEDNGTETEDDTNVDDDIENLANDSGYFMLGRTFADVKEAREAIHEYGVKFGYKLKFVKNDTTRVRVHCGNELNCPFKLFISKDGEKGGMVVKTAALEVMHQLSLPLVKSYRADLGRRECEHPMNPNHQVTLSLGKVKFNVAVFARARVTIKEVVPKK
ncbi:uncharacterized protein LOC130989922 isoform X1 [Salvia miltiorrhiza]|uniref:uncharacterized protein LOC130989922 isoform X1 n=1 Tax=Salvia miltiorrhiza TaxID=226208 RepID=UPI0025AC2511|nr:uncharacterized protein LOC130989922 isoform X1 [Salvia miltiorrhiza]XP_057770073.1 uncharacterized protein LOC130989922 isoform X2 [Salvia miltiorrhiza]XP_057770074.1 uncharacterized protein LOC130989922 isoform X2 [Salvia miltiorrhiza]XP_057770075.1 uncharacterized protein LOC130989922 isoform X2 [Salvia miltiorrhiza]XP_057770076.1 uncharacterized protein LOC130989922 isoform X1 [Salvia miltiorrhiza]